MIILRMSWECLGTQIPERDMVQQCTMKSVTLNYNYCHRVPPEWAKGDLPQLDLDWLRKRICATLGQEFWFNAQKIKWFCSTFCLFRKLFQKKLNVFKGGSNISGVSIGWWSYQLQLLLLLMSTRRPLLGNASEKTICIHSIRSKLDFPFAQNQTCSEDLLQFPADTILMNGSLFVPILAMPAASKKGGQPAG